MLPMITRKDCICPIFGIPTDFNPSCLPSYADVIRCCQQVRYDLAVTSSCPRKKQSFSTVAEQVAEKIKRLYLKASIPTVTRTRVLQMITSYHEKYYKVRKSYNRDKDKPLKKDSLNQFIHEARTKLFDISACKCKMILSCTCGRSLEKCICSEAIQVECVCTKEKRVPQIERTFLFDQRTIRVGKIDTVDKIETERIVKRDQRKEKHAAFMGRSRSLESDVDIPSSEEESETKSKDTYHKDSSLVLHCNTYRKLSLPSTSQMRLRLTGTALTSDRFDVSDRATAAIVSSVLQDIGLITAGDNSLVIDKSKIRRKKDKIRRELVQKNSPDVLEGLYYDGRKDETLVIEEIGNKRYRRTIKEEHISLVQEPGSDYISHLVPKSGSGKDIGQGLVFHLHKKCIDTSDLKVIGGDGTPVNTGWKTGSMRNVELLLQRPLQRSVCMLHFNELPLRHLFEFLDGKTAGPQTYSGPVGKLIQNCEKMPIVEYDKIKCTLPRVTVSDLSKDQKYLLEISLAVGNGICPPELALRDPGPMSLARWLTTAIRVLRLYISTNEPSSSLIHLVTFIQKVYSPLWFAIKSRPSIVDGPKHLYECIQSSRYLPDDLRSVVDKVIQTNAYFAHPENILISMSMDENSQIREIGLRKILKSRENTLKGKSVRTFIVSKLKFEATCYYEMIDWQIENVTSPPLLEGVSSEDIAKAIKDRDKLAVEVIGFPCHTQGVERCVKLVTEAAGKVCGVTNREGYIKSTLLSRSQMPSYENKSQFPVDGLRGD